MENQIYLRLDETFIKILDINNRSYEFKLYLEPKNSILTFSVTDKTEPSNPQNFCNNFSLNQDKSDVTSLRKIVNF